MSPSQKSEELSPTLWRTCRVLANRSRLAILQQMAEHGELSVSDAARELGLAIAVASQYMRALNARGLCAVRRSGRFVYYRIEGNRTIPGSCELLAAAVDALRRHRRPARFVRRIATGFTHPRRIEILRALGHETLTFRELKTATRISRWALLRHLGKLQARGLVKETEGRYRCLKPRSGLAQALMRLALR